MQDSDSGTTLRGGDNQLQTVLRTRSAGGLRYLSYTYSASMTPLVETACSCASNRCGSKPLLHFTLVAYPTAWRKSLLVTSIFSRAVLFASASFRRLYSFATFIWRFR